MIRILKKELIEGKSIYEQLFMISGILLYILIFFLTDATLLSLVSSITGIISVILCSQKKISQFFWSFIQLFTYSILAYRQHFYGELVENAFYFITMLIGMWLWYTSYNKEKAEIEVKSLSKSDFIITIIFMIIAITILYAFLKKTNDSQPLMDAISTVPAFIAQILLMTRYKENWYFWLIIDVASVIMWGIANDWIMVAQYVFWSINCIYGLKKWN